MESNTNQTYTVEEKQLNNKMLIGSRKNDIDLKKSINNKFLLWDSKLSRQKG